MPADLLPYESAPTHPGRFRVVGTADALEVELVPRPAWEQLPWVALLWLAGVGGCAAAWWVRSSWGYGIAALEGPFMLSIITPFGLAGGTFLLVRRSRQRLSIRVDATAVTVTRWVLGYTDVQRVRRADLLAVGISPDMANVIEFVTRIGGNGVAIARHPRHVAEIYRLVTARLAAADGRGDDADGPL